MEYIEVRIKEILREDSSYGCHKIILEDSDCTIQIPIFISSTDAMPLLALIEGNVYSRPRPHDILINFMESVSYSINIIRINNFEKGIYKCEIIAVNTENTVTIDCRPSDAFYISLCRKVPLYIKRSVVERIITIKRIKNMTMEERMKELEMKLDKLIKKENYEKAALIRDKINELRLYMPK
ncbi:MAG: bifunctional nuclease family protein [Rikenellaceae bacterium]|nr:bifunctional nuclease family protein [Rikenellaceae bacterium]